MSTLLIFRSSCLVCEEWLNVQQIVLTVYLYIFIIVSLLLMYNMHTYVPGTWCYLGGPTFNWWSIKQMRRIVGRREKVVKSLPTWRQFAVSFKRYVSNLANGQRES